MDEIDFHKNVANCIDHTRKYEQHFQERLENFYKCVVKQHDIFLSYAEKRQKEEERCKEIEEKIGNLKDNIRTINLNIRNNEKKVEVFKSELPMIDSQIENRSQKKEELKEIVKKFQNEQKMFHKNKEEMIYKIKDSYKSLLDKRRLYECYLNCRLNHTPPDVYEFIFLNEKQEQKGRIKFKCDEKNLIRTVVEIHPNEFVNEEILKKCYEIHDTQGLLCYLRKLFVGEIL